MTPARKHIPNLLTILRLVLAAAFFVVMAIFDRTALNAWLFVAIALFAFGAITDALDGYLARRWQVVSKFGRVVDPFADKVLVLGGFIFLAGPNFAGLSGVAPWMVVVILARELLVTTMRGAFESEGIDFSANIWGKWKMILQSVVIPVVLLIISLGTWDAEPKHWTLWLRDGLVWLTVIVTVLSGAPYVTAAIRATRTKSDAS